MSKKAERQLRDRYTFINIIGIGSLAIFLGSLAFAFSTPLGGFYLIQTLPFLLLATIIAIFSSIKLLNKTTPKSSKKVLRIAVYALVPSLVLLLAWFFIISTINASRVPQYY